MKKTYSSVDEFINDLVRTKQIARREIQKYMREEAAIMMKKANKEYGEKERAVIKRVFKDAVTTFYDSYQPSLYERKGDENSKTGGLYDILDMQNVYKLTSVYNTSTDGDGHQDGVMESAGSDEVRYEKYFNRNRFHKGRDRDTGEVADLYDLVFKEGWHGGAATISSGKAKIWGEHPQGGKPYYRTAGFIQYPGVNHMIFHRWGAWKPEGKAKQTKSPFSIFCEEMQEAENGELFDNLKEIVDRRGAECLQRIGSRADKLNRTLYSQGG